MLLYFLDTHGNILRSLTPTGEPSECSPCTNIVNDPRLFKRVKHVGWYAGSDKPAANQLRTSLALAANEAPIKVQIETPTEITKQPFTKAKFRALKQRSELVTFVGAGYIVTLFNGPKILDQFATNTKPEL